MSTNMNLVVVCHLELRRLDLSHHHQTMMMMMMMTTHH